MDQNRRETIHGVVKYIAGILGFLGVLTAILIVTGAVDWFILNKAAKPIPFPDRTKLIVSLSSSILGIFFLFIAFSKQLDKFFTFLETRRIKTDKSEEAKGVSLESIFFLIIAVALITLAILLAIGSLILKTDLPLLGSATKLVLIGALVVLGILAIVTAFSNTIAQSIKEMNKVHWPTKKEMSDYSKRVFSFIIFFSLFFFVLDLLLTHIPTWLENLTGLDL